MNSAMLRGCGHLAEWPGVPVADDEGRIISGALGKAKSTGDLPRESAFSTFLAYVPPERRRAEFRPGTRLSPVPSQAQLYPTILELLGAPRTPQSFAFALRGEPKPSDYDDCQLLADPITGILVAMRDGKPSKLDLRSGKFWQFYERDYCR